MMGGVAGFHTGFFVGEGKKDHARLLMPTLKVTVYSLLINYS